MSAHHENARRAPIARRAQARGHDRQVGVIERGRWLVERENVIQTHVILAFGKRAQDEAITVK
jgi:hypothetical protein